MLRMWLSISNSPPNGKNMSQTLLQGALALAFANRFIIEVGFYSLSLVKGALIFKGFGGADS